MTSHPLHPHPWYPPLYKYHQRRYIEDLTRYGRVFIGTLEYYRNIESRGSMVPDRDEGRKILFEDVFDLTKNTPAPLTRQHLGIPAGVAPPPNFIYRNNRTVAPYETFDLWLYCMSTRLMSIAEARDVMDPDYDAVAVIHDPWCFGHLLAHEIHKRHPIIDEFYPQPIQYREREYPYDQDDGLDPACIKPPRYARQSELRFIYVTHEPITQPGLLLDVPSLVPHCRILQDEEIPK